MKILNFNKKNTYEQHDNEKINYYHYSSPKIEFNNNIKDLSKVDICIVGGGLSGIATSLYLSKKGYKVVLLEARKLGWGASGRNGGQLGGGLRKEQRIIEEKLGFEHAFELWKLGLEAVDEVKKNIEKYNINCSLTKGVVSAGYYKDDKKYFLNEINHMEKKYNFSKYFFLNKSEINQEINTNQYYCGLLNTNSYHLNPLKYLYGLTKEAINQNVQIYEDMPVLQINSKKNYCEIITKNKIIKSRITVVTCNGYLDNLLGNVRNRFMPINNYVLATEPLGKERALDLIKNNYAVSDSRFIIDYYRISEDWRMLFGGGETLTNKFLKNPHNIVSSRMYKVFPILKNYKIEFCWGGTLAITVNRFPNFGTTKDDKIIYAHGYSGHGLALSTLAGKLIAEYINGYPERFNFFSSIPHMSIPSGDLLRRPLYSLGVMYYRIRDFIH